MSCLLGFCHEHDGYCLSMILLSCMRLVHEIGEFSARIMFQHWHVDTYCVKIIFEFALVVLYPLIQFKLRGLNQIEKV